MICDQRLPGKFNEAQKKMDFLVQLMGSEKKKWPGRIPRGFTGDEVWT